MVEFKTDESDFPNIVDPEKIKYGKKSEFSQEDKVSMALDLCIKALSQEVKKGYWDYKTDKWGNVIQQWKPDTREMIINSVHTLKNILINELELEDNKRVNQRIKKIFEEIDKISEKAKQDEAIWYRSLPVHLKARQQHQDGYLNQDHIFYQNMINEMVRKYREIFEELIRLLGLQKWLRKQALVIDAGDDDEE